MGSTPAARRQAIVSAVVEARQDDAAVAFVAHRSDEPPVRIDYEDRRLRLEVGAPERDRLDALLTDYHVFKREQPATRKADPGVVYLSAVTDPKHMADFVEAVFREVYEVAEGYGLAVE